MVSKSRGRRPDGMNAHTLAREVAKFLPGWTAVEYDEDDGDRRWGEIVRTADGAKINILVGGYRAEGRVTFRGCWPKFKDGTIYSGGKSEAITCADTKTPEALAKDILRRLLPEYDAAYSKALAYVKGYDERATEAETIASRMAALIGGEAGEHKALRGDGVAIRGEPEAVRRLVVRPAYDGYGGLRPACVDFQVHGLDVDTAARVLQIIKEAEERKASEVRVHVEEELEDEEVEAAPVRRVMGA